MRLSDLLAAVPILSASGGLDIEVSNIAVDSRKVRPGDVFVATVGRDVDGHRYVPAAVAQGAVAVVAQRELPGLSVPHVVVANSREALARMAAASNGWPGRSLRVIGVTGTDGKTTTSTLVASILDAAGYRTGLISTVAATIGGRAVDTGPHTTTPDPLDFHHYLATMVAEQMTYAVIETTSHGLDQDRTLGAEYDVAAITNVTREHLDYHGTYENYLHTKGKLFRLLTSNYRKPGVPKVSVLNADDESFAYLRQFPADRVLIYGMDSPADVYPLALESGVAGIKMRVATPDGEMAIESPLLGRYNAYNILAAVAVSVSQGIPAGAIAEGIRRVTGIVGRLERIDLGQDFAAFVDFAHTPNSLKRVLELAHELTAGRVIVTFGCAGLRDREKRPAMGEIAASLADLVVITSEDPRTEDPEAIMAEVAAGSIRAGGREDETYWRIADRAEAIQFAVALARPGDLVITTGKGHEQSMCLGTVEYPWSEHEALRRAIAERLARQGQ